MNSQNNQGKSSHITSSTQKASICCPIAENDSESSPQSVAKYSNSAAQPTGRTTNHVICRVKSNFLANKKTQFITHNFLQAHAKPSLNYFPFRQDDYAAFTSFIPVLSSPSVQVQQQNTSNSLFNATREMHVSKVGVGKVENATLSKQPKSPKFEISTPGVCLHDSKQARSGLVPKPFTTKSSLEPTPRNRREAIASAYWGDYYEAELVEMDNHLTNGTWRLVPFSSVPKGKRPIRSKWVYADQTDANGQIIKFKARLTAMGNFQKEGVDFTDTFASVMRTKTFRILLQIYNSLPTNSMEHWDVKAAFLNAPLEEEVYLYQPEGHVIPGTEGLVCKLDKAIYGLRQAGRAWMLHFQRLLTGTKFAPLMKDEAVFIAHTPEGGWCIVGTHVDDIFPVFNDEGRELRHRLLSHLQKHVTIKNEGDISWALKTKIQRDPVAGILKISQTNYVQEIIQRFGFAKISPESTPAYDCGPLSVMSEEDLPTSPEAIVNLHHAHPFYEAIGCLWWAANISRPDIYTAVFRASQFVSKPSKKLWLWITRIFRYLKGHPSLGLVFTRPTLIADPKFIIPADTPLLKGSVDASFADQLKKRSTLGQLSWFLGALVDWNSKCSTRVLDSSTDAECCSLVMFGKENSWVRSLLKEIGIFRVNHPTVVLEDNTAAIALSGQGPTKRTRHFDISWHRFKDTVDFGELKLEYCNTHSNPADFLTKPLGPKKFIVFRDMFMGGAELQHHFDPH